MTRQLSFVLAVITALLWVPVARGASVWDGGASTLKWGDANNWNPDGVPPVNSTIGFNGAVAGGSTINMAGVSAYTTSSNSTVIDLNNGAGFTIDIGSSNNWTYWPNLNVVDANAYTLLSGASGRLAIGGTP